MTTGIWCLLFTHDYETEFVEEYHPALGAAERDRRVCQRCGHTMLTGRDRAV